MKHNIAIILLLSFAVAAGRSEQTKQLAALTAAADQGKFSGKVVETMDAGGYTYVCVDTGSQKIWATVPRTKVKAGDKVAIAGGMAMENYHSKTLSRDFDVVYFTGDITVNGARPAEEKSSQLPKNHPPITGSAAQPKIDLSNIVKAKDGKTVAEVYADKAKLSGKEVTIRGRVVKYNANILGKNWIHLRDGSGTSGSNDLLVTSNTPAKVGDTVIVTGRVATNKDFGSSYKYDVMLENAKVTVEKGA